MDYEEQYETAEDWSDIYSDDVVDELVDNEEISTDEAAFMKGYNEAEA